MASTVALAASFVASAAFDIDSFALSAACCVELDCWPHATSVVASAIAVNAASVRIFIVYSLRGLKVALAAGLSSDRRQ